MIRRTKSHGGDAGRNEAFYAVFAGAGTCWDRGLAYLLFKPSTVSIPANVTIQPSDTSGFHGYLKGSTGCAGRDHRVRRLSVSFLPDVCHPPDAYHRGAADQQRPAPLALPGFSFAAAPSLPGWQPTRRPAPTSRVSTGTSTQRSTRDNPSGPAPRDAAALSGTTPERAGLDLGRYDSCMKSGKYAGRIQASYE